MLSTPWCVLHAVIVLQTDYLVVVGHPHSMVTVQSLKVQAALKRKIPVVFLSFLEKCIEETKLVNYEDHIAAGVTKSSQLWRGTIAGRRDQGPKFRKSTFEPFN